MLTLRIINTIKSDNFNKSCDQFVTNRLDFSDNVMREEIRMDQTPKTVNWALIPLYRLSADGGLIFCQIGFDGISHIEISHGYDGSNSICTDRIEVNLSSNETITEKALQEARKLYKLKYNEGYQPAGSTTPPLIKAMKGYEYKQKSIKSWPVYTQPKLHGIRMLCQDMGHQSMALRSWLNNPYTHLTHIEQELKEFFPYLPRYCTLDGELYNHNMKFTLLTSAVKTVKTIHPQLSNVQYWIFDINYEDPEGAPFEKRCSLLINAFRKYIQDRSPIGSQDDVSVLPKSFIIVPSQIASNHETILKQHDEYVAVGYEGIMIKKTSNGCIAGSKQYNDSLYKSGKCSNILKYKQFRDEEAIIIGLSKLTEGTDYSQNNTIFNVMNHNGTFPIQIRGYSDQLKFWFENPQSIIGKEVTIRYSPLPIGISIRDYE